jgi:hypothetical protein
MVRIRFPPTSESIVCNHRIYCGIGSGRHEAGNSDVTVDLLPPVELTGNACIVAFAWRLQARGRRVDRPGP